MSVIFVGPLPSPITGQSIAFEAAFLGYSGKKKVLNVTSNSFWGAVVVNINVVMTLFFFLIFSKVTKLYITTSRSRVGFYRDFICINLASLFGVNVINHLHGADFISFRSQTKGLLRKVVDLTYNKINVSIVLSESMKEQYTSYLKMEIVVIPNFFDKDEIEFRDVNSINGGGVKFLFLSNLIYSKGITHLLKAFKLVSAKYKYKKIELHVAGKSMSDEYLSREEIDKIIDTYRGTDDIYFHGVVRGEEKKRLLSSCDVFVLPSFYCSEAQPISIIEAMASGLYILTTDHNYISDLVSSDEGSLINKKDTAALVSAMSEIIEKSESVWSVRKHNIEFATTHFSKNKYNERVNDILDRI